MGRNTTEIPSSDVIKRMHAIGDNRPSGEQIRSGFYALYVIDTRASKILRQFSFDISPQSIRLDEASASDYQATQEGGFWMDERGNYTKSLTVSGTFGFRPAPVARRTNTGGVAVSSGQQIGVGTGQANVQQVAKSVNNVAPFEGEYTGFDRFRDLQNVFRYYWDRKKLHGTASSTLLVWANWKMGEVYIAQPLRFGRDRTAPAGRFKISWNFTLRLVAPLEVTGKPQDFLKGLSNPQGRQAVLQSVRDVAGTLQEVNRSIEKASSTALDLDFDIGREIVQVVDEAIRSVDAFFNDVQGAASEGSQFLWGVFQVPLDALREVHRRALEAATVVDALRNAPDRLTTYFDELGHNLKDVARKIQTVFVGLLSGLRDDVNYAARSFGDKYKRRDFDAARTIDGVPLSRSRVGDNGSDTAVGSRVIPRGSKTVSVPRGVTLKALAVEYLGSAGRWKDIALLNNLRAPYISPGGDGVTVLRPGDKILLPVEPEGGVDENQVFLTRDDLVRDDSLRYGRDLRISLETKDLLVDKRGDLDIVEGLENLRQAVHIKVFTRPGDLQAHPWFGFSPEPGEGLTVDTLSRYQLQFRVTLLSDSRIERVNELSLNASGDVLLARVSVVPKDNDDSLALSLRARVG